MVRVSVAMVHGVVAAVLVRGVVAAVPVCVMLGSVVGAGTITLIPALAG